VKIETIALPIVRLALTEDLGSGDVTTRALVSETARARARIETRAAGVLAGLDVARLAFHELDRDVIFRHKARDGARLAPGQVVGVIEGRARGILSTERVALNFLQHLSGIATLTARFVEALKGTGVKVRDTRKTLPGLRWLEKYAVLCGGGQNHRFGLFDMVLIKDNHLPAAGSIGGAVKRARQAGPGLQVQVEVRNPDEAEQAVAAGADQLLLDNMDPEMVRATLARLGVTKGAATAGAESGAPAGAASAATGRPWIEVSGGVTLENVRAMAIPGVDSVAIGAITHSAPALDLALVVETIEDLA
jgi:nicotinate-nucleotide pyrophosphorylase (carboxylating)